MSHSELLSRHKAVLPSWIALYYSEPIQIVRGEGCYVWDGEGNRYLDFFGQIITTIAGHAIPEVQEAIRRQTDLLLHSSTVYLSELMVELAEKIADLSGIQDAKVFFTTSGTEATDTALLTSCLYRSSDQVLAVRNGYHGRSFAAQSITGNKGWSATSLSGLTVHFVNAARRRGGPFDGLSDEDFSAACVADLRDVLATATSGDVACFMAEPIQGVGAFTHSPDGTLGAIKEVLDEHGILYITDEVQTGWGRTGENFWGYEAHGITPDVLTFAKGIANGMPLGGVVARAEIIDSIKVNSISTFGGNPIACAAALANIDYLLDNDLQTNSLKMGNRLANGLVPIVEENPWIAEMRGKGLMLALEAEVPETGEPNAPAAAAFHEETKARGLLIGRGGLYANAVRICPPLSVSEEQVDEAIGIFAEAAEAVTKSL